MPRSSSSQRESSLAYWLPRSEECSSSAWAVEHRHLIGIGARPDLVVSSLTGPVSAISGSRISATVRVCNQGTTASASSTVTFVVSLDTSLAPEAPVLPGGVPPLDQVPMGGANIPSLAPGACITQSVTNLQVSLPPDAQGAPGARFLGAYVDSSLAQQELREDNNTRTTPLTVTNQREGGGDGAVEPVPSPPSAPQRRLGGGA
ncbi:CARDB domain-containing protein [Myxococcus fulvus]|uniref:CARDB domain-containing protein n=1 Tax=Myxococcus fulvus TaxID=33 RepID=UPI0020C0416C|nr:CARDB domain-containing protein [Myxococcus fulvus]MCK8502477.1 hypothetical protein [Myxococcus fulvus]